MPPPPPADPVKLIAAVLWCDATALDEALERLRRLWGETDHVGRDLPFDATDYYEREMGKSLLKRIVSFARLVVPDALADAKLAALEVEDALRGPAGRRVNIDPGYMDLHKVVLASVKLAWQKVHVGKGVCADMICRYSRGRFHPFEWSFTDYRDGRYDADFLAIRSLYKANQGWRPCRPGGHAGSSGR